MRLIDADTIQWTANGCGHPNCKDICGYTKDDGTCCGLLSIGRNRMLHLKEISYEEARKEFFENLLIHKHNQLTYWLRQHDHYKCSEIGSEISFIEDAVKALEKETDEKEN